MSMCEKNNFWIIRESIFQHKQDMQIFLDVRLHIG